MSELPSTGDLCVCVRACCAASNYCVGVIEQVDAIHTPISIFCHECGQVYRGVEVVETPRYRFIREWTRRIKPMDELSGEHVASEVKREMPRPRERVSA